MMKFNCNIVNELEFAIIFKVGFEYLKFKESLWKNIMVKYIWNWILVVLQLLKVQDVMKYYRYSEMFLMMMKK